MKVTLILSEYENLTDREILLPLMSSNIDFYMDTQKGKIIVGASLETVKTVYADLEFTNHYTFIEAEGGVHYDFEHKFVNICQTSNGSTIFDLL